MTFHIFKRFFVALPELAGILSQSPVYFDPMAGPGISLLHLCELLLSVRDTSVMGEVLETPGHITGPQRISDARECKSGTQSGFRICQSIRIHQKEVGMNLRTWISHESPVIFGYFIDIPKEQIKAPKFVSIPDLTSGLARRSQGPKMSAWLPL